MTTPEEKLAAEMYPMPTEPDTVIMNERREIKDKRKAFVTGHRLGKAEGDAEIARLREYGENMRIICQQLSKRIEELDPMAPRAEGDAEGYARAVEQCAKIADGESNWKAINPYYKGHDVLNRGRNSAAKYIAKAIRALSPTSQNK